LQAWSLFFSLKCVNGSQMAQVRKKKGLGGGSLGIGGSREAMGLVILGWGAPI